MEADEEWRERSRLEERSARAEEEAAGPEERKEEKQRINTNVWNVHVTFSTS